MKVSVAFFNDGKNDPTDRDLARYERPGFPVATISAAGMKDLITIIANGVEHEGDDYYCGATLREK